jgi:nicotinamidase-related amidase
MTITSIPSTSALVLIDLQNLVVTMPLQPRPGQEVVKNALHLVSEFREQKLPVVFVRVSHSKDGGTIIRTEVDSPMAIDPKTLPLGWDEIMPELKTQESDIVVTKYNIGAFYGTDLELQLRRRGVTCIVLGGIATNFGVEFTAKDGYERNFQQIFVEDCMSSLSAEMHDFSVKYILPRLGQITTTKGLLHLMQTHQKVAV